MAMVTCPMPASEENISGAPFPNAMIVTPAMFWESLDTAVSLHQLSSVASCLLASALIPYLSVFEMISMAGQKKSSAETARAINRMMSQRMKMMIVRGKRLWPRLQ